MSQYMGSLVQQGKKITRLIHLLLKHADETWNLTPLGVFPTEIERFHPTGGTP